MNKAAFIIPSIIRFSSQECRNFLPKIFQKNSLIFKKNYENDNTKQGFLNLYEQLLMSGGSFAFLGEHLIESYLLQYPANDPIEDAISHQRLKNISALAVSVFDGHGGPELAQYSSKHIHKLIDKFILENHLKPKYFNNTQQILKDSLKWSYQKIEEVFYNDIYLPQLELGNKKMKNVGSCGITVIVHKDMVYVANSGDSQAIIFKEDQNHQISHVKCNSRLSVNNPAERQRLLREFPEDQRIIVTNQAPYLKGRLQPTRSIGDYYLKKKQHFKQQGEFRGPYLSCVPDITTFQIRPQYRCMVIASDGLWDVVKKQQIAIQIKNPQFEGLQSKNLGEALLKECLNKVSSSFKQTLASIKQIPLKQRRNYHDDISIAVIDLKPTL